MMQSWLLNEITIGHSPLTCHVQRSKRRRHRLSLQLKREQVVVTVPWHTPEAEWQHFVRRHVPWIKKRLHSLQQARPYCWPQEISCGATIMYLGSPLEIKLHPTNSQSRCEKHENVLLIYSQDLSSTHLKKILYGWYQQQALALFTERAAWFHRQLGGNCYQKIGLTQAKSQWGSCNRRGVIRFHWKLLLLALPLIDYVIVHELCHLTHFNHSVLFWNKVASILPDYARHRKQLRELTDMLQDTMRI